VKLLLDTHIWLWMIGPHSKVLPRVQKQIEDSRDDLWLSPISIWELLLLEERGKFEFPGGIDAWLAKAFATLLVIEASLTHEVAAEVRNVRLPHRDPADRFLAATARVYDLTLVTADQRLLGSRDWKTLANY